tara:strand:+ start:126 stop:635 length:510 start_codon:yes stop_codon:yes gene_type:complete
MKLDENLFKRLVKEAVIEELAKIKKGREEVNKRLSEAPGVPTKKDWNFIDSRLASQVNKIFKAANIRVMKHTPFKHSHRSGDSAMYGAFIDTKDINGDKVTLPIEIDNKGIVRYAGGPSGWHKLEKIGVVNMKQGKDTLKLKTLAQSKAIMKKFAKEPGFGQDTIRRKK